MNLYRFETTQCSNPGAPKIAPCASNIIENSNNFILRDSLLSFSPGLVDVISNFQWTTSPPGVQSRQEVPRIELREKRLRTNSVIAAAAYYLMTAGSTLGTLGARLNTFELAGIKDAGLGFLQNIGSSSTTQSIVGGLGSFFEQNILQSALVLTTGQKDVSKTLSQYVEGLNSEYLKAYEGLYLTEDTKFTYYLPYFTDTVNQVNNQFNNSDYGSFEQSGISKINEGLTNLAKIANVNEPGVYIERPKFYSFENEGPEIVVKFPLINTGWSTYDDVRLNWQLIFMLIYQNRPNRKSRELIEPACLYEVTVPGVAYMPFAYISSLKVNFVGSRRQMNLEVPLIGGLSTITTIIPEAYEVELTLTGLLPESKNFLYAMLQDKQDIVNVINLDRFNPFAEAYTNLRDNFVNETARLNEQ
jgi:hypothetical protein